MKRDKLYLLLLITAALMVASCEKKFAYDNESLDAGSDTILYNPTWAFESHGKAPPNYEVVFPQDSVNKIEISLTQEQWNSVRSDMKSIVGSDFGSNTAGGGKLPAVECKYVDVKISFKGKVWKNVGFRLKGNSSLSQAWGQGIYKLPFRLNFDKFEDTYEAIKDQHFYGFSELSFSPGFRDQSLMREKITADIFRMAGVPAAMTSFCRVYIDFGSGLKYCGIYTIVEIPDDNMIKEQYGDESGNIYKPESKLNVFRQSEFEKKNNKIDADYSDVKKFIAVLNSSARLSNPQQWRSDLESVFNVDHFIRYLAANNAVVNWDSYGTMAHNYYLYNHSDKKLIWIPWDHNEALSGSPGITGSIAGGIPSGPGLPGNPGSRTGLSLSMNEVTTDWPLIRYIADDITYIARYKTMLKWFNDTILANPAIFSMMDKYHRMILPYAIGENGEKSGYTYLSGSASFIAALDDLKTHISSRKTLIASYTP